MKAVIVGSTLLGIVSALKLKRQGFDVDMIVGSTFVLEDFTGTWTYFPAHRQEEGIKRVNSALQALGLPTVSPPLLPGKLKKRFCEILHASGIQVHYMARAVGASADEEGVHSVLYADKYGLHALPSDLVVDAGLYGEFMCNLSGRQPIVKQGHAVSLLLEMNGAVKPEEAMELFPGITLYRGVVSEDSAYVRMELRFDHDILLTEARNALLSWTAKRLPKIFHTSPLQNARLQSAFSPCVEAEVERENLSVYLNVCAANALDSVPRAPIRSGGKAPRCILFHAGEENHQISADVLVIGGGTAGMRAAIAAAEKGATVCLAEFFPTLGGTRTAGGIQPPYYGNRNQLFLNMWKEITDYARETGGMKGNRTSPVSEAMLYEKKITQLGIRVLRPAIAFEAPADGGRIEHVSFATENGCVTGKAKVYVDATGDGDLAVFAGVRMKTGNEEMGLTQNYSQTHRYSGTVYDLPMADQDIVDINDPVDMKRAIDENNERCGPYDITEMMTVRESRRIEGRECIRLSDVFRGRTGPDVIYEAMSDYDTHSRSFTLNGRLGVLPMHAPIQFTSVPYGALMPRKIDNMLVCGKAISVEQDVVAYLRMCPDIMCTGHAVGLAAAQAAAEGVDPPEICLGAIQKEMLACGGILHEIPSRTQYAKTPQIQNGLRCLALTEEIRSIPVQM